MSSGRSRQGKNKANRAIIGVIYAVSLLFLGMLGYLIYFLQFEAPDRIGNSYNARMEVFNNRYIRGSLLSQDGQSLAKTVLSEEKDAEGKTVRKELRQYPYGEVFAQAIGYSTKGKTGLEATANFYLMQSNVNPLVKIANEITETKSLGDNVVTSLHAGLQEACYQALGDQQGAVIVSDVKTGRILAEVSKPGYDPNKVVEDWETILSREKEAPLLNRATQGLYAPGSTFKIVVALEYMRENPDFRSFRYVCDGEYRDPDNPDYVVHCFNGEKHGEETLQEAFAESCNAAFSMLATGLDQEKLKKTTEELLFNQELPVNFPASVSRFQPGEAPSVWDLMQTGIGQGNTMESPLHEVMLASAIANGGTVKVPTLMERVVSSEGKTVKTFPEGKELHLMSTEEAQLLKDFMRMVVTDGTASKLKDTSYEACGKTGSAEVQDGDSKKTIAWFTGFAPYSSPEIAISVVAEDGETGGRTAAPIARKVMDYWFSQRS